MLSCHCWLGNLKVVWAGGRKHRRSSPQGWGKPCTPLSQVISLRLCMEKAKRPSHLLVFSNLLSGRTSFEPQSVGLRSPCVPPSPGWIKSRHQDSNQSYLTQGHASPCAGVLVLFYQSQSVSCSNPNSKSY